MPVPPGCLTYKHRLAVRRSVARRVSRHHTVGIRLFRATFEGWRDGLMVEASHEGQHMAIEDLLDASTGPLRGLLVLDFGQAAVGPIAAEWLGMLGATVIKVESPKGDFVRWTTPLVGGMGTTFI